MISKRYISEGHDVLRYDVGYQTFISESKAYTDYLESAIFDLRYGFDIIAFEAKSDDKDKSKSSGSRNIFARIGDKIKAIFRAIRKFFEDLVSKLKDRTFDVKSTVDKYEKFKKEHPSEASSLKVEVDKGVIDLDCIKSLSELDKGYESIVNAAESMNEDQLPFLKRKWKQLRDKFTSERAQKTMNAAKVAIGLAAAIATLTAGIKLTRNNAEESRRKREREEDRITYEITRSSSASEARDNIDKAYCNPKYGALTYRAVIQQEIAKIEGSGHITAKQLLSDLNVKICKAIDSVNHDSESKIKGKDRVDTRIAINTRKQQEEDEDRSRNITNDTKDRADKKAKDAESSSRSDWKEKIEIKDREITDIKDEMKILGRSKDPKDQARYDKLQDTLKNIYKQRNQV